MPGLAENFKGALLCNQGGPESCIYCGQFDHTMPTLVETWINCPLGSGHIFVHQPDEQHCRPVNHNYRPNGAKYEQQEQHRRPSHRSDENNDPVDERNCPTVEHDHRSKETHRSDDRCRQQRKHHNQAEKQHGALDDDILHDLTTDPKPSGFVEEKEKQLAGTEHVGAQF